MREIFAYDRITDQEMERAPLSESRGKDYLLQDADLLFARQSLTLSGAGKVAMVSAPVEPMTFESHIIRVRLDPKRASAGFYFQLFRSTTGKRLIQGIVEQVAAAGIRSSDLGRLRVPLPPLEEQERIAGVLGAFDDLIETNRRLADQLDEVRVARVSAALAESTFETRLSDIAAFVNGRNFTKGADGVGRPVIRTPEVRSGPGGNTVWNSVEADDDRIASAGDILFVWSGTLMVNRWLYTDGLVNQHVFKVIPHEVPAWYVYALIEAQLTWFLGLAKDKATTMGHIQRAHLEEPVIGLNDAAVQRLSAVVEPIWSGALELRREAQDLARQRDELLPLLMSGEVRVRDAEDAIS